MSEQGVIRLLSAQGGPTGGGFDTQVDISNGPLPGKIWELICATAFVTDPNTGVAADNSQTITSAICIVNVGQSQVGDTGYADLDLANRGLPIVPDQAGSTTPVAGHQLTSSICVKQAHPIIYNGQTFRAVFLAQNGTTWPNTAVVNFFIMVKETNLCL